MAAIQHKQGEFVAQCPFGTVKRELEYPYFVYHHPDGRTARIGISEAQSKADIGADGVTVWVGNPSNRVKKTFPWG